jgi:hypothetical protein
MTLRVHFGIDSDNLFFRLFVAIEFCNSTAGLIPRSRVSDELHRDRKISFNAHLE